MSDCANGVCEPEEYAKMKSTINARIDAVDEIFKRLRRALSKNSAQATTTRNDMALFVGVDFPDGSFINMRDVDWKSKFEKRKFARYLAAKGLEVDIEALVDGVEIP